MTPYYDAGGITLYNGDCLEVMPQLAAQSFDAVITDVPYGTTACAWDSPIPFAPMWACLKRLARPRAAIVLFGSQPFTSALIASNFEMFKYSWVWKKNIPTDFLNAQNKPLKEHEDIPVFSLGTTANKSDRNMNYYPQRKKGKGYRVSSPNDKRTGIIVANNRTPFEPRISVSQGDYYPTSVLEFSTDSMHLHPTQKPLALMEYLIRTYTNEGDTVLDFTSGSGTTLRAAKNLKRRAVGIEQLEHYCAVTVKRLEPAFEQALVDNGAALDDLPMFATEASS